MTINLKEKNQTELKALAYDISEVVQQYSQMLQTVNQEVQNRKQEEQVGQSKVPQTATGVQAELPLEEIEEVA